MNRYLFFIESTHPFHRYDIIERIIRISRFCKVVDTIYLAVLHSKPNVFIIKKGKYLALETNSPLDYILSWIKKCNMPVILDEKGRVDFALIGTSDCFIAGLYSDLPEEVMNSLRTFFKVRLSNIPYLASMLLPIIDYIILQHDILLNSNNVNLMELERNGGQTWLR